MKFLYALPLLLCGCILFPTDNGNVIESHNRTGSVKLDLCLDRTKSALSKSTSADTIFRMDSLYITLSTSGQSDIISNNGITGRSDSSTISISNKIIGNLASLRTWKAKFISVDTVFTRQATAQSGATSTITLDASASANNNVYSGYGVYVVSGTGSGQVRLISGYVGSTKVATVTPAWDISPSNSSTFRVYFKDTVHVDSINFIVNPADTTLVSKTLTPRFSILRVRVKSDSASLVPSNIRKLRFLVDNVVRDSIILNSKTFDNLLTYKYLTPNTNHTLLIQAFDTTTFNRGYERFKNIRISSNSDTTISLDTTIVINSPVDTIFVRQATASGGSATTIKLDGSASSTTGFYKDMSVLILSGTGVGQTSRVITGYTVNGSNKTASITPSWTTAPDNTTVFRIVTGGSTTTVKLNSSSSGTTNFYSGMILKLISGTGSGQERIISAYNSSTKIATMATSLTTVPNWTSSFSIYYSLLACGRSGYPTCTP